MVEAAVLVDKDGGVLAWHLPPGRTSVSIPDTRSLWSAMWEDRAILGGLAHSHPGSGFPSPSREDLTTFAACEAGLGVRLDWWIITRDEILRYRWSGPDKHRYTVQDSVGPTPWIDELRDLSYRGGTP